MSTIGIESGEARDPAEWIEIAIRSLAVIRGVDLDESLPLRGNRILGGDGVDGAGLDASIAIDALGGIDVQLLVRGPVRLVGSRMDAVDRAYLDARCVLGTDARLADDVCDDSSNPRLLLHTHDM